MSKVQWWELNKSKAQQWDVVYVDEMPRDPVKGEMNNEYGFIVERDFYLVTALPSRRMLSRVAENKLKIKVKNGMTNQKWWFDQASLTVKSRMTPSQSWNINGNGGSKDLSITTT
jgi:hypothetical protein